MNTLRFLIISVLALAPVCWCTAAEATSGETSTAGGWQPLYNGKLDEFRIYFRGQGYITDVHDQTVFIAKPDHVHVVKGTNGLLVTKQPFSHYHVKVDYRWGDEQASKNAGLMTHVDLHSASVKDNRPRSIEINMRHDCPGSMWMAASLGPFGIAHVADDQKTFLPADTGGMPVEFSPFKNRTLYARYPDGMMNTKAWGEWNTLEAIVHGSESVEIILNGVTVNRVTNLRAPKEGTKEPGEPLIAGGIGLQSEGQEIFYRNFVIKQLQP